MFSQLLNFNDFQNFAEKGDIKVKIETLKKVIQLILNGEKMPSLLMHVIKFLMPLQDHTIKKLLLIFWEIIPKTGPDGKLLHEMILVCDAYRKVWCFTGNSSSCSAVLYYIELDAQQKEHRLGCLVENCYMKWFQCMDAYDVSQATQVLVL